MYAIVIYAFYLVIATYAIAPPVDPTTSLWANMLSNSDPVPLTSNPVIDVKLNASSFLNVSETVVSCFINSQEYKATHMANYFVAVQQILTRDDALTPRQFYLGPSPDLRWKWTGDLGDGYSCTIVLANKKPLLTDPFPIVLVAHVAALIAQGCITEEKGYAGGWASAGPERGVVLVGKVR